MRAGFVGGTVIERGPAQVGLAWSPEVIVITPRGSSELIDWVHDVGSVVRVRWGSTPGVRVGWGFRRQARALIEPLVDLFQAAHDQVMPDRGLSRGLVPVVVTGHSLGAALVPLLVSALSDHAIKVDLAFAHCSPRVGNAAWAAYYDRVFARDVTPTWSIVNVINGCPDLVTRVPKRRWGFRHVGRRVILSGSGVPGSRPEVLLGDEAWHRFRAENPVGHLAAWRIISRTFTSARAHLGNALLSHLRSLL